MSGYVVLIPSNLALFYILETNIFFAKKIFWSFVREYLSFIIIHAPMCLLYQIAIVKSI